jgi:Ca2+-binding RTX toxin-like protein
MTKITAGLVGLDMRSDVNFSEFADATPTTATSAKVVFEGELGTVVTVKGAGFAYNLPGSFPYDGDIHSVRYESPIAGTFSITDTSINIQTMLSNIFIGYPELTLIDMLSGDDRIVGSRLATNHLFGSLGDDVLIGGSKSDTLVDSSDVLSSAIPGGGADTLYGGRGADLLDGEGGADAFLYRSILDSRKSAPDSIMGLDAGDMIDLRAIDAKIDKDGNQAFEIVAAFTGKAGQMRLVQNPHDDNTDILMDVDGDAKADMIIIIDDEGTLTDYSGFTGFVL